MRLCVGECWCRPQCFLPVSTHICLPCPLPLFWVIFPAYPDFLHWDPEGACSVKVGFSPLLPALYLQHSYKTDPVQLPKW